MQCDEFTVFRRKSQKLIDIYRRCINAYIYSFRKMCPYFSTMDKSSGFMHPEPLSFPIFIYFYPNRFFSAAMPSASTAALLASWIWR